MLVYKPYGVRSGSDIRWKMIGEQKEFDFWRRLANAFKSKNPLKDRKLSDKGNPSKSQAFHKR